MTNSRERLEALRAAMKHDLFTPVLLPHHFWLSDPYDVPAVHAHARREFEALLANVAERGLSRLMLLLGAIGVGKTHLLRALRSACRERAVCAYAQFNPPDGRFERRFLAQLIDSLEEAGSWSDGVASGFDMASAVIRTAAPDIWSELDALWENEPDHRDRIALMITKAVDKAMERHGLGAADLAIVTALVYAMAPAHGIKMRAMCFLRGEALSAIDQAFVPALPSRREAAHLDHFVSLCRTLSRLSGQPFVFFFDQAEGLHKFGYDSLQHTLDMIFTLIGGVPNLLVVIAWEQTRYGMDYADLPQYLQDRMRSGSTRTLSSNRSEAEIRLMLEARFNAAFAAAGLTADPNNPLDPLAADLPRAQAGETTHHALEAASDAIERLFDDQAPALIASGDQIEAIDALWRATRNSFPSNTKWTDEVLLDAVAWACLQPQEPDRASRVIDVGVRASGPTFWRDLDAPRGRLRLFALTKPTSGGALTRQIETACNATEGRLAVGLRLGPFPKDDKTQLNKRLNAFIEGGGRCVQIGEDELHFIATYRSFVYEHGRNPNFADWAAHARPLDRLRVVKAVLDDDAPASSERTAETPKAIRPAASQMSIFDLPERVAPQAPTAARVDEEITLGLDDDGREVRTPLQSLTRHAVVLGGSGSGKTTFLLRLVEQALLRGVPTLLLDRKGDFAAYADPEAWTRTLAPAEAAERDALKARIAVSLYTPGKAAGRSLTFPVLPADFDALSGEERDEAARAAGDALAQMIGLKETKADGQQREVLRQALGQADPRRGLAGLIELLDQARPSLTTRLARLDQKGRHRQALVPMLEGLRLSRGALFESQGDPLDMASLLASTPDGRTRLCVVSLAFLSEVSDQLFFVSRLLAEARRFCRMQPSERLQAVLVLDEADAYAPALSKPATKEPLLDLLRRARSGGLGVLLGTQSPGDLDYRGRDNIATWALGRIQEKTALNKIAFVGEGSGLDVRSRLPRFQGSGRFLIRAPHLDLAEAQAYPSLIEARQRPEEDILRLSRLQS